MALYPLPSSSNESVIDNGRNVWQMSRFTSKIVFDHSQRRSPNARYRSKVPASNKILVLRLNLLTRCRLSHACKDASLEVQHSLRHNVEQSKKNTCTISTLFSLFLHAKKRMARCRSTRNWSECAPSTWPSKAQSISADRPLLHACTFRPGDQATTMNRFLEIWLCEHRRAAHWRSCFFLFFFFFYCRSHNETGPNPLPPIWKFFRLSATCEILRWPLTA